jgi:serine/threonine protein kinase
MKYPSRSEYCSAIRNPHFAFRKKEPQTKIERDLDASLALGKAVERTKSDGTKDIWSAAGSFAIAFKFETLSPHRTWAIRCFYRSNFEVKQHYKQALLRLENSTCRNYFVDFTFLEEGIRVQGNCYPILKMEWIEGENLKKFIKANLGKKNVLLSLAERWRELCKNLYEAGIAHGDLQHGNVLIVKSFQQFALKLIDYDSLYFLENKNLVDDNIKGLPDYQHPLRQSLEKRCLEIDFFPQLAIYLSILALAEDKKLWESYQLDAREGLLFSRIDFQNPDIADIFKSLAQLPAPIPELAKKMKKLCLLKELRNLPNLETILSQEQGVESHHTSFSSERYSSSSPQFNSILSWLKERTPQLPLKREARRECPQARGEARSEPAVKITMLPSEIQPSQSLAESPKRIAGWDPRSLKSDYVKYIKPVSSSHASIHTTGTKISQIPTQIGASVKQKTEVVLNRVSTAKDNLLKACDSALRNFTLQLRNLKSIKGLDYPPTRSGGQEKSKISNLRCDPPALTELAIQAVSRTHQPQTPVQLQSSQPTTQTTAQVAAQLGCSLSWCHAQRYQHPDRFLSDTHYYKDTAGVVHWMEAGIEELRCLKSQKKFSGIPANSLPTKEVSRRLGVSPELLTKTKAKHSSDFVVEIHYHTDARKRYYWTPTGIELLQQLLKQNKPLVADRY